MILKVDYKPEDVILNKEGRLLIKLKNSSIFSISVLHLCTTEGETVEDYTKNTVKNSKSLFVSNKGTISIENC